MNMNKELTQELKATYWRITRLMVNDDARMRLAISEAYAMVARVSHGAEVGHPGL